MPRPRRVLDACIGVAGLFSAFLITNSNHMPRGFNEFMALRVSIKNALLLVAFLLLWTAIGDVCGLYTRAAASRGEGLLRILKASVLCGICGLIFPATSVSRAFSFFAIFYFFAGILLCRSAIFLFMWSASRRRKNNLRIARRILIVGSGPRALESYQHYLCSPEPIEVLGFVDHDLSHVVPPAVRSRIVSSLSDLEGYLMANVVDEVMITLPAKSCYAEIESAIRICERVGTPVTYRVDLFHHNVGQVLIQEHSTGLVTSLKPTFREDLLAVKRLIDIVGATFLLISLSPLLLLLCLVVKLSSRGPILFVQERYGLHKRRFKMLKFRTMVEDAEHLQNALESQNEAGGPVFKMKQDPRITYVGGLLRKTSLDELPQLVNVLCGEMSLVGPRPLPLRDVNRFAASWLLRRFSVKPGLTCLWQVNGRSNTNFDTWIGQDLTYIDTWSLSLDFKIMLKTLPAVLRGSGAM